MMKVRQVVCLLFCACVAPATSVLPCGKEFGVGRGTLLRPSGLWGTDSFLLPSRPVKVWLPPGYDENKKKRYPTLYVHDGQNAMEDSTSWTGQSWRLGESLTRLSEQGLIGTPPIVVLIDNTSGDLGLPGLRRRHMEYGDQMNPIALSYLNHVSDSLRPRIDACFRTLGGPEHTAQLGTSLGGQMAFLSVWRRPDCFGAAACLSPAFQTALLADVAMNGARLRGDSAYAAASAANAANAAAASSSAYSDPASYYSSSPSSSPPPSPPPYMPRAPPRIYMDNGGDTDDATVPLFSLDDAAAAVAALLQGVPMNQAANPGYFWLDTSLQPGIDVMATSLTFHGIPFEFQRFPGGRHNERAWAQRIDKPLLSLYGARKHENKPYVAWL